MKPIKRHFPSYTTLSADQADRFSQPVQGWYTVEVRPADNPNHPATLNTFVKSVLEIQTGLLGFNNYSPTSVLEIRRHTTDSLRFQFSVPTKRMERKVRTHLKNQLPNIELTDGINAIPVTEGDSVGGGLVTTGRRDWYPLQTEFDEPPVNSLVGALHRHAIRDTGVIIQILFKPVAGHPLHQWYWNRRAYQRIGYLRKEKEKLWNSRSPTPREKRQADAIERKAGTTRFHVSIRLLCINSKEYTPSRVKELAGGFNVYENPDTGQYLNAVTVQTLESRILHFAQTVKHRQFGTWHRQFHASTEELAALVSIPDRTLENIQTAKP